MKLGFPIAILLRGIAANCSRIASNYSWIARNCEEFTGLAIARKQNPLALETLIEMNWWMKGGTTTSGLRHWTQKTLKLKAWLIIPKNNFLGFKCLTVIVLSNVFGIILLLD